MLLHKKQHPIVSQLLHNRNLVDEARIDQFLYPDYKRDIHDPFLFRDMEKSVARVFQAIANDEKIMIHGDYDADGICGSAILFVTLQALGAKKLDFFLPHREKDGYGMNDQTIEKFISDEVGLIVTCDCGVSNKTEIALALKNGIETIITDHHQEPDELPEAFSILHPKIQGETYPDKTLSGGGVAFKFAQALLIAHKKNKNTQISEMTHEAFEKWLLDLVAISSVADMVPLIDETRTLTKYGLVVLNKTRRLGLKKLMETAGIKKGAQLDATSIGFRIAPRLNAAGRMHDANQALALMLESEDTKALDLAQKIHEYNVMRQKLTEQLTKDAKKFVSENHDADDFILFVRGDGWSPGIIGLIASRLKDKFFKPVIVLGEGGETYVGSGRSIPQFDITNALNQAPDLFSKYGGHPQACGFSLKSKETYPDFTKTMTEIARAELNDKNLVPILEIEAEMKIEDADWQLWNVLEKFSPFGMGNPEPLFVMRNVQVVDVQAIGKTGKHMRLFGKHLDGTKVQKFIAFGCEKWLQDIKTHDMIDMVFEMSVNEWNGRRELQLKIVDYKKL